MQTIESSAAKTCMHFLGHPVYIYGCVCACLENTLSNATLSPVLFTLYTNDCTGTENTIFIKYSDDTAIVDLSNSIPHYIEEVDRFTTWCKANFLDLNVAKTKELLIDFRKQPPQSHLSQ